ncbi:substrate-binding domain-containing protein [Undibacterium sp. TS12]|uniref:substrate-binding domain-containing protein n=1 Tax=Undibacterium sp. TS12 TaxID=2908202 RepID=UPI001F4CC1BA|nr:substrate-binding domain-containing protein [Undibacterium sp. TS12]
MRNKFIWFWRYLFPQLMMALVLSSPAHATEKLIVYITPGLDLPFWRTLGSGVKSVVESNAYRYEVMDSTNDDDKQMAHVKTAIAKGAAGIVISPTDSKSATAVLALASQAKVPVVIADIGTNGGDFVSYVKADNYKGAYGVGVALAAAMKEKGWVNEAFALCTISLSRKNGQDRTNGFRDAMKEAGFTKEVALRQMQTYTIEETYAFVSDILKENPKLRGLFIEVDKPTLGALAALKDKHKTGEVLVGSFDGIPEFIDHLKSGTIVAVGMQQPYLIGTKAAEALFSRLAGQTPPKQIIVPILIATNKNIIELLPTANKTVFGNEAK